MPDEPFDLTGKRALIAGAGSPVGQAIERALSAAGATVVADPAAEPPNDLPIRVAQRLGGLEVFVSCLDLKHAGPFVELADEDLDRVLLTNLTLPLRLVRSAGRAMLGLGGGRVILVHSILAERGVPNTAAYSATQAGLAQLVRALAIEWARSDVRINGIALGWLEGDPLIGAAAERLARFLGARRLGRPDDVGALAVYLASDAADMMTGRSIALDGGAMAHA